MAPNFSIANLFLALFPSPAIDDGSPLTDIDSLPQAPIPRIFSGGVPTASSNAPIAVFPYPVPEPPAIAFPITRSLAFV